MSAPLHTFGVLQASDLEPWHPHIALASQERFSKLLRGRPCAWCGDIAEGAAVGGEDPWLRWVPWCSACDTGPAWAEASR